MSDLKDKISPVLNDEWLKQITTEYLDELFGSDFKYMTFNIDVLTQDCRQQMISFFENMCSKWSLEKIKSWSHSAPYYGHGHTDESRAYYFFEQDLQSTPFWKHYPGLTTFLDKMSIYYSDNCEGGNINERFGWELIRRACSAY